MSQLQKELEQDLEATIKDFEETGALPSIVIEWEYSMLLAIYRNDPEEDNRKKEQKYMSFMAENYFKPRFGDYK